MAKDTQTPDLTRDDVTALIEILRKARRPMTTDELVAALREAAARG
jgi:predicted transcriptional regulator